MTFTVCNTRRLASGYIAVFQSRLHYSLPCSSGIVRPLYRHWK
jgi:hypothetical protein